MAPIFPRASVGIDLVSVTRVIETLTRFGDRFLERVFTPGEIAYAQAAPGLAPSRLAARFAAKEAAFKALRFGHGGIGWREIEVVRPDGPGGAVELVLHGKAASRAQAQGLVAICISLSHEGDSATAIVLAQFSQEEITAVKSRV